MARRVTVAGRTSLAKTFGDPSIVQFHINLTSQSAKRKLLNNLTVAELPDFWRMCGATFDLEGTLSVIFKAALKPFAFGLKATSGQQNIICA